MTRPLRSSDPRPRFSQHNMAEGLDSSIERMEKLLRPKPFIQRFLKQVLKFMESEGMQELVRPLISAFRKFRKNTMRKLLSDSSEYGEIQKKLLVFVKALYLHEAFEWSSELGDLRSLPSLCEDRVNNGRSNDGVGPFRGEENGHVSSGNNEGRLDDHSGSKDVSAGLISVRGIEEPDPGAGETPGRFTVISPTKPIKRRKSTVIPHGTDAHGTDGLESSVQPDNHVSSVPDADGGENPAHGTDGLERSVQSVIEPKLRQVVDNLGDWKRMLEDFNLGNVLRITPSYSYRLKQITNNLCSDFPRLLQLRDRNPSLSSEDLKVYCVPLRWSSKERVDFWSDLSDKLFSRATAPNLPNLRFELERTWQLHFGEKQIDRKGQWYFGKEWFHKIDERWIEHNGRDWIHRIDRDWINIIEDDYMPWGSYLIFVRGLLRFVRNRWHHPDEFQESRGLRSAESFYNYFDGQFPCLLMVSYGVAYRFCRDEPWFEKYREVQLNLFDSV